MVTPQQNERFVRLAEKQRLADAKLGKWFGSPLLASRRIPDGEAFDPDEPETVERLISMYCPPGSHESLNSLYSDPDLQLRTIVAGGGQIDLHVPSDIYASLLCGENMEFWTWMTFPQEYSKAVQVIDICEGRDLVREGVITYDSTSREIRVNVAALPLDEWRLICLANCDDVFASTFNDRAVLALRKVNHIASTLPQDPARLILEGHLIAAWRLALSQPGWTQTGLRWLLGNLFGRMQTMLKRRFEPAIRLRDHRYDFLLNDVGQISSGRLDSLKQGLWDKMSVSKTRKDSK